MNSMRVMLIASSLLLMALAMPAEAGPGVDACEGRTGVIIDETTGGCSSPMEPWQCLGGSSSSRTYTVAGVTVVINQCSPPNGGGPDPW